MSLDWRETGICHWCHHPTWWHNSVLRAYACTHKGATGNTLTECGCTNFSEYGPAAWTLAIINYVRKEQDGRGW